MKIAILGTRGVPPTYGGFETMAAELGVRLVARGHEVSVYCRGAELPETWNGIRRIVVPALHGHKYLETVSHSFLSALDAIRRGFDAVLVCNAANAFVLPLLRAARIPVAINVDGIERKRRKWNILGRTVYTIGEAFSAAFASAVVADADVIARYYRQHYAIESTMIPYGAEFPAEEDSDVLERLGLRPRAYVLYVSRFEPENNPLEVVEAYERQIADRRSQFAGEKATTPSASEGAPAKEPTAANFFPANCDLRSAICLVMLGKGLYAPDLVAALHRHAGKDVLFPGALYGRDYRTLQRNALLYIQATEVGGTHPAMIEAMASGGAVLAHDTPENREVGENAVAFFQLRPVETLSGTISELLGNSLKREEFRVLARKRAEERYSWSGVTESYERLFRELAGC